MPSKKKTRAASVASEPRSLDELGKTASQVVQEAAAVLEEELAAGLIAARNVSQRLAKEQRFETEDFADALKRFRATGHQLIEMARGRLTDLRTDETQDLLQRFLTDAQGGLDTLVDLIGAGPELANRFVKNSTPPTHGEAQPADQNAKSSAK